jgi:chaperone required for assembly of F1-ATPase
MAFDDVPLTRLAGTLQEKIRPDPAPTVAALAAYGESDLLCYRAEQPPALAQREAEYWQPWLDWAASRFGAKLNVTAGIVYVRQPPNSLAALREAVTALSPSELTALGVAVPAMGSLVLGLALAEQKIDAAGAHALAALDELFQAELWGDDSEAVARRKRVAADIALAERFMRLSR